MIQLSTGIPGSGKTLYCVSRLQKIIARFESHPEESRPIFANIKDLKLPHSPVPLKSVPIDKAGRKIDVPDWDQMPEGSLIILDECQDFFPPRASASLAPDHILWFCKHRQSGIDLWLLTQNPKFIDSMVRANVGKHQHFRRLFGGKRSMVYEWDACCDSLNAMKTAVTSLFNYPKNAFQWYKSAEIHTKQSFRLPKWLLIPVLGLAMGAFFMPKAIGILTNGITGKGLESAQASQPAPVTTPSLLPPPSMQAQGHALAVPVAQHQEADYSKPFENEAEKKPARTIKELKLAHGVYSDDPELSHHLTNDQKQKQLINAALLESHANEKEYQHIVKAYREELISKVKYVPTAKIGEYVY